MIKNIIKSSLSGVVAILLMLAAAYEWTVAGYILMVIGLLWFVCESTQCAMRGGWVLVLVACIILAVLGFGVTFPIILVGIGIEVSACFFVLGAEALVLANAYVWSR